MFLIVRVFVYPLSDVAAPYYSIYFRAPHSRMRVPPRRCHNPSTFLAHKCTGPTNCLLDQALAAVAILSEHWLDIPQDFGLGGYVVLNIYGIAWTGVIHILLDVLGIILEYTGMCIYGTAWGYYVSN